MNPNAVVKPITGIWAWFARTIDVRLENNRLKRELAEAQEALLAAEAQVRERDTTIQRLEAEADAARIRPGGALDILRRLPPTRVV